MRRIAYLIVYLSLLLLISGCTFTHNLDSPIEADSWPKVPKIPVHAGVYYSTQFTQQEYTRMIGPHIWKVPIGTKSVQLFDKILPQAFEKISKFRSLYENRYGSVKDINFIVSPSIEHFDFRTGMDSDSDRYSVSYRLTLYSTKGVPVASWVENGNAKSKIMWTLEGSIEDDLNDAAHNILLNFEQNARPALAALAKSQTSPSSPIDQTMVLLSASHCELPGLEPGQLKTLNAAGVVCIHVTAQNKTGQELIIRSSDMHLLLENGVEIEPSSLSSILSATEQTSQAGNIISMGFGPLVGVAATYFIEHSKQATLENQIRKGSESLFGDRKLSTSGKETGFVLFHLSNSLKKVKEMAVKAWVIDPYSAEGVRIEAPLNAQ